MSTPEFEAFLARLYTDAAFRTRVMADPEGEARRAGLDEEQCHALAAIDRHGLALAARSFEHKRARLFRGGGGWRRRLSAAVFH